MENFDRRGILKIGAILPWGFLSWGDVLRAEGKKDISVIHLFLQGGLARSIRSIRSRIAIRGSSVHSRRSAQTLPSCRSRNIFLSRPNRRTSSSPSAR